MDDAYVCVDGNWDSCVAAGYATNRLMYLYLLCGGVNSGWVPASDWDLDSCLSLLYGEHDGIRNRVGGSST